MSATMTDPEVFKYGKPLLVIDGWASDVEPWVQRVACESGQRVDWLYFGGRAVVLVLGDYETAMAKANDLEPWLVSRPLSPKGRRPRIISRFTDEPSPILAEGTSHAR